MKLLSYTLFLVFIGAVALPGVAASQIEEQCPQIKQILSHRERNERFSRGVREQLIKLCIKEQKQEFEELVARTEEIAKLTGEIKTSFDETQTFTADDRDKLERVEKLVKKVRTELNAADDDDEEKSPDNTAEAVDELERSATSLFEEIKKTTRHSISLVAVKSSNAVMKIVKFLRFGN